MDELARPFILFIIFQTLVRLQDGFSFSTCNDVYAPVLSVSIFIAYIGQLWVENWFDHFRNMCYIQFERLLLSDRFVDMF